MSDAVRPSDSKASKTKAKVGQSNKKAYVRRNKLKWLIYLFLAITVFSLIYLINALNSVSDYNKNVNELKVYASRIVNDVNEATFSSNYEVSAKAYESLQTDLEHYEQALVQAREKSLGDRAIFDELAIDWQENKEQISYVLENRNSVDALHDIHEQVKKAVKEIQESYTKATEQAVVNRAAVYQITTMEQQIVRAERIETAFLEMTLSNDTTSKRFIDLTEKFYNQLLQQQQALGNTIPALEEVKNIYKQMLAPVAKDLANSSQSSAINSREMAQKLSSFSSNTHTKLENANSNILLRPDILAATLGFVIGLLGTLTALYTLSKIRSDLERRLVEKETLRQRQDMEYESERARKIQEENERNQMAILRLLDELGDLAEGDLTVNATVSEDFTGAIADSVNFAIDQLRQLVLAINTTAVRVAQSSEQTQMTAMELAEASENQAQEIAGVSAAINEMVVSIDQVSMNAGESASVAERSVAIAHNGAEVVQRSIEGMNTIREQIQETSKRIKRLGESSQEIGDIIGLINDIADQTNVLALNAAIQASMAGEAGRGFAVVADEVQRLAERSANATKQIETLVKTIQADTSEAVMSMESTTTEVVRGARLAKDAGEALEEVQTVSNTLADLIQNISNAAQQQASSAGHISKTMNIIQDITSQTSSGTMATARSVGQLNEMASALQESVSGFKLDDGDEMLLQEI